jgi:ABC-type multidrug transport system fused ATPase/permease subunit
MIQGTLLARLLAEGRRVRGRLAIAIAAIVTLGASQLYLTWLVKRIVDGPIRTGTTAGLSAILIEAIATVIVAGVALGVSRYAVASANAHIVERLRLAAMSRVLGLTLPAARAYPAGDVLTRILTDAALLSTFFGTVVRRALRELVVAVGAFAMLFVINWRLALAGSLVVPPAAWLIDRFGRRIRRWSGRTQDDLSRLGALASEQLAGLSTVKVFRAEDRERARFANLNAEVRRQLLLSERQGALLHGGVFVLTGIALAAVVTWGARLLGQGFDQAAFLAFALYAAQIVEPIRRLSELHGMLQTSLASVDRLYALIDAPGVERGGTEALPARRARAVHFDRVTFGYRRDVPVIEELRLRIEPGEQLALIGASGAGKSTITALLLGFRAPDSGQVLLDGIAVNRLTAAAVREAVIVVEQEPFLFSGTVLDNLRYGAPHASMDDVVRVVEMTGLTSVVQRLPHGLTTSLAEAGRQLSGGEKQRIALARAILCEPSVLVLDEATNAMDGELEGELFARLSAWLRQRTVIAISHRWSTVARFPRVVLLLNGRVAADGPLESIARDVPGVALLFGDQWLAERPS